MIMRCRASLASLTKAADVLTWGSAAMSGFLRRHFLNSTGSAAVANGVPFGRPYQAPFAVR